MAEKTDSDAYDPTDPEPPARGSPRRSTAPQSEYTGGQVGFGLAVLAVGLLVTVVVPLLVA